MKKFLSLALALVMALSLFTVASRHLIFVVQVRNSLMIENGNKELPMAGSAGRK